MTQVSQIEERALMMLGSGAPAHIVAAALGVTEGRISQMMAEEEFAQQVQDLRFHNLQKHTLIDEKYQDMEGKLLDKLEKVLPLMTKPRDVLAAVQVVNNAKRRGAQVSQEAHTHSQVVHLTLPVHITHKFISNVNNQVIEVQDGQAGRNTSLVTTSSGSLDRLAREILDQEGEEGGNHDSSPELPRLESPSSPQPRPQPSYPSKRKLDGAISVEDLL
ncbi:hypothetical protein D3C78_960440 [compost metagenome]